MSETQANKRPKVGDHIWMNWLEFHNPVATWDEWDCRIFASQSTAEEVAKRDKDKPNVKRVTVHKLEVVE